MATAAENGLTREGLIWLIVESVSKSEDKPFTMMGHAKAADRDYILSLVAEAVEAVDGKRPPP